MKWLAVLFVWLPQFGFAEAVYPEHIPARFLGADQKESGSCRAESEVSALEHSFARHKLPVRLSSFYRHAYNWHPDELKDKLAEALQVYEGNDRKALKFGSTFWPLYLWPEDARGVAQVDTRSRPSFQKMAVVIPGLEHLSIKSHGLTFQYPAHHDGWADAAIVDFEHIKNLVRQRLPVTFSIHGALLYRESMDHSTGFLRRPYSRADLPAAGDPFVDGVNHSVALVGFDDSLYDGQGAMIVHNSWNSTYALADCQEAEDNPDPSVQQALQSMRLKIAPTNLPGYFAVPYAYYRDMIAAAAAPANELRKGAGSGRWFEVDHNQVLNVYLRHKEEVQVFKVPYSCNRVTWDLLVEEFERLESKRGSRRGDAAFLKFILKFATWKPTMNLRVAILPVAEKYGADRVMDLATGKLDDYYCAGESKGPDRFPNPDDLNDPTLRNILEDLKINEHSVTAWYRLFDWARCKKNGGLCL